MTRELTAEVQSERIRTRESKSTPGEALSRKKTLMIIIIPRSYVPSLAFVPRITVPTFLFGFFIQVNIHLYQIDGGFSLFDWLHCISVVGKVLGWSNCLVILGCVEMVGWFGLARLMQQGVCR